MIDKNNCFYDDPELVQKLSAQIKENSALLNELHRRVHQTCLNREQDKDTWHLAAQQFNSSKSRLIFPFGYDFLRETPAKEWNFNVVEAGLCFLEIRPYHFNSGYTCAYLFRHLKNAFLTEKQKKRLIYLVERQKAWRAIKRQERANQYKRVRI